MRLYRTTGTKANAAMATATMIQAIRKRGAFMAIVVVEPADLARGAIHAHRRRHLEWVAYDELLASWGGAFGGPDPATAYRRYVTGGLSEPPESPWTEAYHGWILGSRAFIDRLGAMVRGKPRQQRRRESRLLQGLPISRVSEVVCAFFEIERAGTEPPRQPSPSSAALAYLARSRTVATNAELAPILGVSRRESVPNLTRV